MDKLVPVSVHARIVEMKMAKGKRAVCLGLTPQKTKDDFKSSIFEAGTNKNVFRT